MRIVSLLPSATEIVYALGVDHELEGVTFECDYPPDARRKTVVSDTALPKDGARSAVEVDALVRERMDAQDPLYVLDAEAIDRIRPDLILTQDLCRVCAIPTPNVEASLQEIGCTAEVVSLDPHTLGDVLDAILQVGRATGRAERATELVGALRDRIETVRRRVSSLPRVATLALEWLDPPFVGGHWVPEMVDLAGGDNLLTMPGERSTVVRWSAVAASPPDVVVFMPCGYDLDAAEAEAPRLFDDDERAAALNGTAVYAVDASAYFSRPGPRLVDGIEILASALHPDACAEPPGGRIRRVEAA